MLERRAHALRDALVEERHVLRGLVEHRAQHVAQEGLGQRHVAAQVAEGHLGLDHPELGQVAAGVRVLGAEGGAERVDAAERERDDLRLELARHGQVGRAGAKNSSALAGRATRNIAPGALGVRGGDDRRVQPHEAALLEEAVDRARGALRTRSTAPSVFVRGRRWAIVRRNSKPWRFFCSG